MLDELCRIVRNRSQFDLSVNDLSGQGIERTKNYLSKVAGMHTPFTTSHWQRAKLLGKIRNAIAHRNDRIAIDPNKTTLLSSRIANETYLTLHQLVEGQDDAQIVIDNEFLRQAIQDLQQVASDIINYALYENES